MFMILLCFMRMFFKVNTFFFKCITFNCKLKKYFFLAAFFLPLFLIGQEELSQKKSTVFFGKASYYDAYFNGRKTANGEIFSHKLLTAAHPSWPFNTKVRVTNLSNSKSIVVRINDRGPFIKGRHIDVSEQGARVLGFIKSGVVDVKMEIISWGKTTDPVIIASNSSKQKSKRLSEPQTNKEISVSPVVLPTFDSGVVINNKVPKLEQIAKIQKPKTQKLAPIKQIKSKPKKEIHPSSIMCSNNDSLSGWCVQVGSYGSKMNADRTLNFCIESTQEWACIQEIYRNEVRIYRVVCGKNIDSKNASEIKQKLSKKYPDAFITNYSVLLNNKTVTPTLDH